MDVISCQNLSKRFGAVNAVSGLDLDVAAGQVYGFLGPNGAGKTTTIRMMLGLAFYLFLAVANSPWVWRMTWPPIRWARVGSLVVGIVFVLWLVYAELFKISAICLWCTSVHVITFALFVLIMFSFAAGYGARKDPALA